MNGSFAIGQKLSLEKLGAASVVSGVTNTDDYFMRPTRQERLFGEAGRTEEFHPTVAAGSKLGLLG